MIRTYQRCCDTPDCVAGNHVKLVKARDVADWLCKVKGQHKLAEALKKEVGWRSSVPCENCGTILFDE